MKCLIFTKIRYFYQLVEVTKTWIVFRLYEAIVAGSIPVICGTIEEVNVTFKFNNIRPYMIITDTWDKAVFIM